ncbi:MAG: phage virion morphogenesis protein [Cyanobacteria bacterium P01_C01_bin.120]
MANINITTSTTDIIAQLRAAGLAKLDDPAQLQTLYKLWINAVDQEAVQAFRTEISPSGQPWADLQPATLRYSRNPSRRGKLRDTSALFGSLAGQIVGDGIDYGSSQSVGEYSLLAIHHFGAPRASIPARPSLPMDDQGEPLPFFVDRIEEITLDWLGLG